MRREQTLQQKVGARIAEKQDDVFLTREFSDLGRKDYYVTKALAAFEADGSYVQSYEAFQRHMVYGEQIGFAVCLPSRSWQSISFSEP